MNDLAKNLMLWVVVAVVLMVVFQSFQPEDGRAARTSSIRSSSAGRRQRPASSRSNIGERRDARSSSSARTARRARRSPRAATSDLVNDLINHKVEIKQAPPSSGISLVGILINFLPLLLFIGFWIYFMRQMQQGGGKGAMSFGRSRAKLLNEDQTKVTFADVAGCDEAKEEVAELVEFLRDPGKFQKLGGKIPRGVLMVGPPGHRQDAARHGDRRRSQGAVLLDLRFGLRRDVRRRRRQPRARHVRAGQEARAVHHLHRRNRRGRPPSRRGPRRRARRARADAQPVAGRDGRFRRRRRRDRDRRDQPPRRARSGAAAPGPFRPPGHRRPARREGPRADPARAHAQGAAGRRRRCDDHRARHAGLQRRRPRQPRERSGACSPRARTRRTCAWSTSTARATRS